MTVTIGLEVALDAPPQALRSCRAFGLLSNQASVDRNFQHAADLLHARFPGKLKALFSPQHGLWSAQQDNMIETAHGRHPRLGLPVHSLYSETRRPTEAMLSGLDLLVIDLQDVGTRVYTWIWTIVHCLEACAQKGIPVLVLDRPNPIGGELAEGPRLDLRYRSFVGLAPIPMRHGLTLGELTKCCNDLLGIGATVYVQPMQGWRRAMLWPDTGRTWVGPSPNLPRWEGTLVYPGQVLLEGTNLSEGRGTTTPFEQWGAPWIDPWQLLAQAQRHGIPGSVLRPVAFEPTFHKFHGRTCHGFFGHVTDPRTFRPYRTTLLLLRAIRELWPTDFGWRNPPYEYEHVLMPIDILCGSAEARAWVEAKGDWQELDTLSAAPADWWPSVQRHCDYDCS
jgi:uncharacterized protein YbbC (DUF1343 family)